MTKSLLIALILSLAFMINCSGDDGDKAEVTEDTTQKQDVSKADIPVEDIAEEDIPTVKEEVVQEEIKVLDIKKEDIVEDTYTSCLNLVFKCMIKCEADDADCEAACLEKADTEEVANTYTAMNECLNTNCADTTDALAHLDCIVVNCADSFAACYPGSEGCETINQCAGDCSEADTMCFYLCMAQGSKVDQQNFVKYTKCIDEECGHIEDKKSNEYQQCSTSASYHACSLEFDLCFGSI